MKKFLILGGGRTGIALDRYLTAKRIPHTWIADTRLICDTRFVSQFDEVILSPGVPPDSPAVTACVEYGVPYRSELDFAAERINFPIGAVTGTNGKTTTTRLVYDMLRAHGLDAYLVGNGGVPLTTAIDGDGDVAVTEVSSFMCETAPTFHPRVSAITNITPDHLNRHTTMERYIEAKKVVFSRAETGDSVILNADDPIVSALQPPIAPYCFSLENVNDAYLEKGELILFGRRVLSVGELKIKGRHNVANVLCAMLVSAAFGVSDSAIARAAANFRGVAHRIEYVGSDKRGVKYYNDSKATNIASALTALSTFDESVVLIAGGSDKGENFEELIRGLPVTCRRVIATGATASAIAAAASSCRDGRVEIAADFCDAVRAARDCAHSGECVLLSPACASFDSFANYRSRGDAYVKHLRALGVQP